MTSWLNKKHPDYDTAQKRRDVAWDLYTGAVYDKLTSYLIQHKQGEYDGAYEERRKTADYTNHMATVVDGLAGMMFAVEEQAERDFGGLGDLADVNSTAARLWRNADGAGTNYPVVWRKLAPALISLQEYWVMVEGLIEDAEGQVTGEASIRLVDPRRVENWIEDKTGDVVQCRVTEQVDARASIREDDDPVVQHVVYGVDGWQRWRVTKDENGQEQEEMIGEGTYAFYATTAQRRRVLPIFRVRLPLPRPVGYLIARKAKAIFNLESSRDWLLWVANFPKLLIDSTADIKEIQAKLKEGGNIFTGVEHTYITPPTEPAQLATEVLEKKVGDFRVMAMREYGDAARERTATEIRQEFRTGVEAFLTMLKSAMDEAEGGALWRLEQVYFPNQPSRWGQARVERANQFLPEHLSSKDRAELVEMWQRNGFGRKAAMLLAGYSEREADAVIELDQDTIGQDVLTQ